MSKLWLHNKAPKTSQWSEVSPDEDDADWIDISNDLCLCSMWGLRAGAEVDDVVEHLKTLYDSVWSTKTDMEKHCLAIFCIASKADRDTIQFEPEVNMTNGYAHHEFALHDLIREDMHSKAINEVDYNGVRELASPLKRRETWDHGHLLKIELFKDYNESTDIGTDKVVEINTAYTVNDSGDLVFREKTRDWYLHDGVTIGMTTVSPKDILISESIKEGNRRRKNIVDQLKKNIPGLIMATQGVDVDTARLMGGALFITYKTGFELFIELKLFTLATDLLAETATNFSWIEDQVPGAPTGYLIRNYLHDQIQY
jgi:hypothetical protein